jgi:hypothetical protein
MAGRAPVNGYPRGLGEQVFFERTQHVLAERDIGTVSMIAPATAIVHKTKADRAKMVAGLISMTRQQRPRPCAISLRQGPTIRAGGFTSDPLLQRDAATRRSGRIYCGGSKGFPQGECGSHSRSSIILSSGADFSLSQN